MQIGRLKLVAVLSLAAEAVAIAAIFWPTRVRRPDAPA
jgi:hypothetical protein